MNCAGIDFASENIVVAIASTESPYVAHPVRDVIGNDSIPDLCSFSNNALYFGERALPFLTSNPTNSITSLPYIIKCGEKEIEPRFVTCSPFDINESIQIAVKNDNVVENVRIETLLSLFIDYCMGITNTQEFSHGSEIAITVPDNYGEKELKIIKDTLSLIPKYNFVVIPFSIATAYTYGSRLYKSVEKIESTNLIFFDQGSFFTTISLFNYNENKCTKLYSETFLLGCKNYDNCLLEYIIDTYPKINNGIYYYYYYLFLLFISLLISSFISSYYILFIYFYRSNINKQKEITSFIQLL